ncbi:hypothetical protein [Maricaulis sp.]|uniref:hypothetical protein n=1 Tax=Maricaulis sp. TaxID=1486257 RepID=UPI002B26D0C5|nr:hypothetical protein [Maricaulis sp.]
MRKRRHVRRRKALDQRQARLSDGPTSSAPDDDDDLDVIPPWERDSIMEDFRAITVARETGQPLPEPRDTLSWIFAEPVADHETVIPHQESLIWRACQAAYADAEDRWKSRCETLAKRKSSGRWPELSDRFDDAD